MEGKGAEQSERSAYYRLSLAEKNAQGILKESRKAMEELRRSMNADEVNELERGLALSNFQQPRSLAFFRERVSPRRSSFVG